MRKRNREYDQRYRVAHREETRAYCVEWRKRNKDKKNADDQAHYLARTVSGSARRSESTTSATQSA
jgi:hypothetical protein